MVVGVSIGELSDFVERVEGKLLTVGVEYPRLWEEKA